MIQAFATWATAFAAVATAIATFFLWRVTRVLAVETKRMADLAAQPQIVASIVPNQWSMMHADIQVENTGNAAAFDIVVIFDPPLTMQVRKGSPVPFQRISVLKPGQMLESFLSETEEYLDKQYAVTISWTTHPAAEAREELTYTLNMADYDGVSIIGKRNPSVQIAEEVKHLRDDWKNVATGQRRIKTETFNASDRKREQDTLNARFRREKEETVAPEPSAKPSAVRRPGAKKTD